MEAWRVIPGTLDYGNKGFRFQLRSETSKGEMTQGKGRGRENSRERDFYPKISFYTIYIYMGYELS